MVGRPQMILRSKELLQELMRVGEHDTVTLAAAAGLSKQLIAYLHSGARKSCSRKTAEKIAAALGCQVDTLFCPGVSSKSETKEGQ